jgi:Fuc2NAc and GlcNAc transferase
VLFGAHRLSVRETLAFVVSGGIVAVVGFVDDHRHVAARWRLLAHGVAAAIAVWLLGAPIPPYAEAGTAVSALWVALVVLALVWLLNLYNFMDGIDGIAGIEAVTVCASAALVYRVTGAGIDAAPELLLAAAALGFLLWNFPPARIFMGDAGSGFLGLVLGVLAVRAGGVSSPLLWSWVILLGVFTVDATVTLLRRLARGDRVYEAHRSHAYQHAAKAVGRHGPASVAVALINLCWLFPWALLVGSGRVDAVLGVAFAYLPLVWLAWRLGAGRASP